MPIAEWRRAHIAHIARVYWPRTEARRLIQERSEEREQEEWMRPVLRDMCLGAMQTRPHEEWTTEGVAQAILRLPNGIRSTLKALRADGMLELHEIRHKSYIEARWVLTDDGRAYQVKGSVPTPPNPDARMPSRWPGRDHEALQEAWPHPVQIPQGGTRRKHTMEGGWA